MSIGCAWCGRPLARGQARMRLFATPDSSVRTTSVVAHFHPDCGEALVHNLASRRDLDAERWTWARGPRAIEAAA